MPCLPDTIQLDLSPIGLVGAEQPLRGLTVLAVEDSRFACDALRLMCRRSGARLRRADTLEAAAAHLRVYRPDVVLIDLGLPDGRGEGLIESLVATGADRPALLGMSGDDAGRALAMAAGADGFLDKPLAGLAAFQSALRAVMPGKAAPVADTGASVTADPQALLDDLALAAAALTTQPGLLQRRYLAGFLTGIARHTGDGALQKASAALGDPEASLQELSILLNQRLAAGRPFGPAYRSEMRPHAG